MKINGDDDNINDGNHYHDYDGDDTYTQVKSEVNSFNVLPSLLFQ